MAIDTSKIEGYAEMSLEDKVKALEAYDPEFSETVEKYKRQLSKANSEAADWKKQYREKLTEQEKADAERAEADKALRDEVATLRREKTVSDYTAQYVTLGYDSVLARETAEAMADGKSDVVFANHKKHNDALKSQIEAGILHEQTQLKPGTSPSAKTKEDELLAAFMRGAGMRGW